MEKKLQKAENDNKEKEEYSNHKEHESWDAYLKDESKEFATYVFEGVPFKEYGQDYDDID